MQETRAEAWNPGQQHCTSVFHKAGKNPQERKGKKGIRVNPQSINKGGSDEENVGCQQRTGRPVTAAGTNEL